MPLKAVEYLLALLPSTVQSVVIATAGPVVGAKAVKNLLSVVVVPVTCQTFSLNVTSKEVKDALSTGVVPASGVVATSVGIVVFTL